MNNDGRTNEEELVRRAARGDRSCFEALISHYHGMVFSIAFSRLLDGDAAEDLAQEVFLRVYLNIGRLQTPRYFATWLTRIARNLAADWHNQRRTRSQLVSMVPLDHPAAASLCDSRPLPSESLQSEQEARIFREALSAFHAEDRELILLHFVEGATKSEIARRWGQHPSSIARRLDRLVSSLKDSVAVLTGGTAAQFTPGSERLRDGIGIRSASVARTSALLAAVALLPDNARTALALSALEHVEPAGAASGLFPALRAASGFGAGTKCVVGLSAAVIFAVVVAGAFRSHTAQDNQPVATAQPQATRIIRAQNSQASPARRVNRPRSGATIRTGGEAIQRMAAGAPAPAQGGTTGTAQVSGRVLLHSDDKPVSGAMVELVKSSNLSRSDPGNPPYRTTAAADGVFRFVDVPAGRYLLYAEKDTLRLQPPHNPLVRTNVHSVPENQYLVVADAQSTSGLVVRLHPGYTVCGTVRNALTGNPVEGVEIYASSGGKRGCPKAASGTDGRYCLEGVFGVFEFTDTAEVMVSGNDYQATVKPGLLSEETGIQLSASDGSAIEHDIWVQPTVAIAGKLVTADGQPAAGIHICALMDSLDHRYPGCLTESDGTFKLAVRPWCSVQLSAGGLFCPSLLSPVLAIDDVSTAIGTLVVPKPAVIAGVVVDEAGQPIGEASVTWRLSPNSGPRTAAPGITTSTRTNAEGCFELAGLLPGECSMHCTSGNHLPSNMDGLVLAAGESSTALYVLRQGKCTVAGRVTDESGLPVAGATVTASPRKGIGRCGNVRTGDDGRFLLGGLADTKICIHAFCPGKGLDEAVLEDGHTSCVEMVVGGRNCLPHIVGKVVDAATGMPIANCTVAPNSTSMAVEKGREPGTFQADLVGPLWGGGLYQFWISAPGYETTVTTLMKLPLGQRSFEIAPPIGLKRAGADGTASVPAFPVQRAGGIELTIAK